MPSDTDDVVVFSEMTVGSLPPLMVHHSHDANVRVSGVVVSAIEWCRVPATKHRAQMRTATQRGQEDGQGKAETLAIVGVCAIPIHLLGN